MYIHMSDFCKAIGVTFSANSCKPSDPDLYKCAWQLRLIPDSISLERHISITRFYCDLGSMLLSLSDDQYSRLVFGCSALGLVERSMELLRFRQEVFPSEAVQASPSFRL